MFDPTLLTLLTTAIGLAVFHTVVGVDHYLPFVVLGRARGWGLGRTSLVASLCGIGHVFSSVLIGGVGLAVGVGVEQLVQVESMRGGYAAWMLIGFGCFYAIWSWRRERRGRMHSHVHVHADGSMHSHPHNHAQDHAHAHREPGRRLSSWALFVVFVLGPCEVLIPLLMAPAAGHHWGWVLWVAGAFSLTTVLCMVGMTCVGWMGLKLVPTSRVKWITQHAGTAAGLAIAASGLAIQVLGI